MTDREIMQQALEALVLLTQAPTETALDYADNAIDALRERLAQPEQEPVAWMVLGDGEYGEYTPGKHFDTVGYKEYWERRGYELQPLYTAPPQRKPPTDVAAEFEDVQTLIAPPQRELLAENEFFKLWVSVPAETEDRFAFARAIEAARGIKENT